MAVSLFPWGFWGYANGVMQGENVGSQGISSTSGGMGRMSASKEYEYKGVGELHGLVTFLYIVTH